MWALQLFRRIVSQSLNNVDDGAESVLKKCSKPFSFEENKGNSEFEIVQILRDEEYQYGLKRSIVMAANKKNNINVDRPIIQSSGYNGSEPVRICPNCNKPKPISEFGFRKMGNGQIRNQSWCKDCR